MNDNTKWQEKHRCSIENYIREDTDFNYSICREERQYAVFLYNILRKFHAHESRSDMIRKIITEVCRIPEKADIQHVFYEAAFMRDFFERNRRIYWEGSAKEKLFQQSFSPSERRLKAENSFNYALIQYVCKSEKVSESFQWSQPENHLGQNKMGILNDRKQIQSVIREMMNAKPDLAVIYHVTEAEEGDPHELGRDYLLFLECKCGSGESTYESGYRQCEIQGKIADFLCNHYLKDNMEASPFMKNDKKCNCQYASLLIQFARKKADASQGIISISDLIHLNNQIFS